jgi:hypothetical protein
MTKYKRNFPCALCGDDVFFERVMNGWTVTCGCGVFVQNEFTPNERSFELVDDGKA